MEELKEALQSLETTIALDSRDWAGDKRSAWIYGIVCGWSDECYEDFLNDGSWDKEGIERNKRYFKAFELAKEESK